MTALVTSVVVEQPLRSDVRALPSFKRHARPPVVRRRDRQREDGDAQMMMAAECR